MENMEVQSNRDIAEQRAKELRALADQAEQFRLNKPCNRSEMEEFSFRTAYFEKAVNIIG